MYLALCLSFVFLSGFTGLVYQVTWQRYLAYHLGSNALATTLVLTVFFLFLSLGYFAIGRWSHLFVRNKLFLYGILEGLIGAYCLLSPVLFRLLAESFSFHVENASLGLVADLGFTALFIGFPTFLMGGTIPVLTDALTSEYEASHRTHALIYGTNTAGAFLGALAAGFVLLEQLGLPRTLIAASCVNLLLFVATFVIARVSHRSELILEPAPESGAAIDRNVRIALLGQSFLSGFYVFSLESLLIRMAGVSLGSTTYTYSIIVSSFVLAIAIGSLSVSLFRRIVGLRFFLTVQSLVLATVVVLYLTIPSWPALFFRTRSVFYLAQFNHGFYWTAVLLIFLVMLLIPVGLMGMNLPLLFNYLRSRRQYLSEVVGQIYAVNSVGSALGAAIGGYWLFHFLEGDEVFKVSVMMVALSIPLLLWLFAGASQTRRLAALLPLLLVPLIWLLPGWNGSRFAPGLFLYPAPAADSRDFAASLARVEDDIAEQFRPLFSRFDPGMLVHVLEDSKGRVLFVNGKPDSHTSEDRVARTLTALTPISIAPKVDDVFIIGLGAGLSTAVAASFEEVRSVKVAEISQGVIDALPFFADANVGLEENRAKVEIVRGDARQVLLRSDQRYDLILCEPSSTWVAGVEKLFTLDFYRQGAEKLEPGGIYAQWLSPANLDDETFLTIVATFARAFPWTTAWSAGGGTITLLGSSGPPELDFERLERRFEEQRAIYAGIHLNHPLAILGNQLFSPALVSRLVADRERLQSLERPLLAYRSGRAFFAGMHADVDKVVAEALAEPLPANDAASRFLLDSYPGPLPPEYFTAKGSFDKGAQQSWNFALSRSRWLEALAGFSSGTRPVPDALRRQAMFLLSDSDFTAPASAAQLIQTYWMLKFAQFPARTDKVVASIDAACARGGCAALQYRMLRLHLSADALEERGLAPPTRAANSADDAHRLQRVYDELFHREGSRPVAPASAH